MWFKDRPDLVEDIRKSLKTEQPELDVFETEDSFYVTGKYIVKIQGKELESYDIKIQFPHGYPQDLPIVFETGNRLPKIPARHFNQTDSSACLFVPYERWRIWPLGSSFQTLLTGAINDFFIGQVHYEEFGFWPHGERAHGDQGVINYFSESFGLKDRLKMIALLEEATKRKTVKFMTKCPCGSGKMISHCHFEIVEGMRQGMPKFYLDEAIKKIKSFKGP